MIKPISPSSDSNQSSMLEVSLVLLILAFVMPIVLTISLSLTKSTLSLSAHIQQKNVALDVLHNIKNNLKTDAVKIYPECNKTPSNSLKYLSNTGEVTEFLYNPNTKQILMLSPKVLPLLPSGFEITQMQFACSSSLDDYFAKKVETVSFSFTLAHKSKTLSVAPVQISSSLKLRSH